MILRVRLLDFKITSTSEKISWQGLVRKELRHLPKLTSQTLSFGACWCHCIVPLPPPPAFTIVFSKLLRENDVFLLAILRAGEGGGM